MYYAFEIPAEVYRAMSAIGPISYAKKAENALKEEKVEVGIVPILKIDGTTGLALQIVF